MFGKKVSGQTTQKLFMTPAVSSAVAPSARNFQEVQQVTIESQMAGLVVDDQLRILQEICISKSESSCMRAGREPHRGPAPV